MIKNILSVTPDIYYTRANRNLQVQKVALSHALRKWLRIGRRKFAPNAG